MKPVYLIDTNVVLRFLQQDDPAQSPACVDLFTRAEQGEFSLQLTAVTFAELVWVLTSFYKHPRAEVGQLLSNLLQNPCVLVENKDGVHQALQSFAATNADFVDCYLAAQGRESGHIIVTYDKDFKKFPGLACRTPEKV